MKKLFTLCMALIIAFGIVGCGSEEENHEGEAKTPSDSSIQQGKDYLDVCEEFEKKGFTNIKLEILDDLIFGWLTKDGEVESVSVDGDVGYAPDVWYPADVEVVITYHTFPTIEHEDNDSSEPDTLDTPDADESPEEESIEEILTVENCPDLAAIFAINADRDPSYSTFASNYSGRIIEFDGSIDYVDNHVDYDPFSATYSFSKYRYDVMLSYGDYDAAHQVGPNIRLENVFAMKFSGMSVGSNVRIRLKVGDYNSNTGLFAMELESVEARHSKGDTK